MQYDDHRDGEVTPFEQRSSSRGAVPPWADSLGASLQRIEKEQRRLRQLIEKQPGGMGVPTGRESPPDSPPVDLPLKQMITDSGHAAPGQDVGNDDIFSASDVMNAGGVGKANLANDMLADTELQKLIGEDKAFERILDQLKTLQVQHELRHKKAKLRWLPILHPDGKFRSTWDLLLALVLVFTCFVVPLRLAWPAWFGDAGLWLALDVTFDVYFISDLCLNFITGYYKDSIVIMEAFPVIRHYLRTWFFFDFISSFPFDHIFTLFGASPQVIRLNKIFRLFRLFKLLRLVRSSKVVVQLLSRTQLNPALVFYWHWIACIWWFIGTQEGTEHFHNFIADLHINPVGADATGIEYITSYYWAVMITTGLGVPGSWLPSTQGEAIFEIFVTFMGTVLQAYLLGSAASALSNIDAASAARRRKLDAVKQYVRYKRVPMFLREKIIEYYEYVYTRMQSIDEQKVLKDLPSTLKVQLAVVLNAQFLTKVPIFKFCEARCIVILVQCMRTRIYLPGEVIIEEGVIGSALFFIRMGEVEISRGETIINVLSEFDFFGEQSFLARTPSLATVRATQYCEIMFLEHSDFSSAASMFPDLRLHVLGCQREQLEKYKRAANTNKNRETRSMRFDSPARFAAKAAAASAERKSRRGERMSERMSEGLRRASTWGRKKKLSPTEEARLRASEVEEFESNVRMTATVTEPFALKSKQTRVRDPSDDDGDTGGADTGADTGGVDCESDTVDEGAGAGEQAESRYISGQEFTPRRSLRSKSIMPPKEVASDFSFLPAMIGSENLAMEHRASLRFTSLEETNMNAADDPIKVVENFVRRGSAAVSSAVGRKQSLTVEGGTPAAAGTRRRSGASDQVAPYTSGPDAPAP